MRHRELRFDGGFSLLELVIVISIIALLVIFALQRLWALSADAEKVAMEQILGSLRSAIGIKVANHIVRNDWQGLRALEASNPMEQLAEVPGNYLGVLKQPQLARIEGSRWYYDATERVLVYRVRNAESFKSTLPGPARARFKVQVVYGEGGVAQGVRLVAVEPYVWVADVPQL